MHICTCVHVCMCTYAHRYTDTCEHVYICTQIHSYRDTCTCAHIHTRTGTNKQTDPWRPTHWDAGLEAAEGRGAAGLLRGGGSLVHLGEHARHLHIQVQMYVNTRTHTHTHHHLIIILARMRAICITGRRHRMHSRRVQAPLFTRHSMRALSTCTLCMHAMHMATPESWARAYAPRAVSLPRQRPDRWPPASKCLD